jgi:hypothetical protein
LRKGREEKQTKLKTIEADLTTIDNLEAREKTRNDVKDVASDLGTLGNTKGNLTNVAQAVWAG